MRRRSTRTKSFSTSLGRKRPKLDNNPAAKNAKVKIRRNVLDAIGADQAHVFDAFAGAGQMHEAVWKDAASCVGCDLKWFRDDRLAFVCNNLRVLRAVELKRFTVFDLDAYGSPWEQVVVIAARRGRLQPGERLGMVLTEGSGMALHMSKFPAAMRLLGGIRKGAAGGGRSKDELYDRAIAGLCTRMGAKVAKRWQATNNKGARMRYIGLVLESAEGATP